MPNKTSKTPKKILAIAPGTREMGVAVLEDGSLIYFAVKNLKQGKLPQRVLRYGTQIVESLMDEYEPQILALEKTSYHGSKRSPALNAFCKEIKTIARRRVMTKNRNVSMTNVITVQKATKEFPKLVKDVKGSKRRYVLSLKGKTEAVVLGFDDYLRSILRSKRSRTLTRIQEEARIKGLNKLTLNNINAEITAYRSSVPSW